jgi:uncharacterized protein YnzC (UPF0291/DUF896 family)
MKTNVPAKPFEQAKLDRLNELTYKKNTSRLSKPEQQERRYLYQEYLTHTKHKWYPLSKWILIIGTVLIVFHFFGLVDSHSLSTNWGLGFLYLWIVFGVGWYQIVALCRFVNALATRNCRVWLTAIYLIWSVVLYLSFWFFSPNAISPAEMFYAMMSI